MILGKNFCTRKVFSPVDRFVIQFPIIKTKNQMRANVAWLRKTR